MVLRTLELRYDNSYGVALHSEVPGQVTRESTPYLPGQLAIKTVRSRW